MASSTMILPMENASAYSPHDPIFISGDEDFTEENGVISGSGIPSDPYMISGWEITVSTETAIQVSDTSASFVLKDLHLIVQSGGCAASIWQASSFAVEGNVIESSGNGINLWFCTDFSIEGNTVVCGGDIESNFMAIYALYGTDFRFESNSITGSGMFGALDSNEVVISENEVKDDYLEIKQCTNVTISNNSVGLGITISVNSAESFSSIDLSENTLGDKPIVYLSNQNHLSIKDRAVGQLIVANCTYVDIERIELQGIGGMDIQYSENVTVSNCTIEGADVGIMTWWCKNVTVTRSLVQDSRIGIYIFGSDNATVIEKNLIDGCDIGIRLRAYDAFIRQNMISNSTCAIGFESGIAQIYSNCFVDIIHPALCYALNIPYDHINWNADYPIGGNYWSNYTGTDEYSGSEQDQAGADGFGDTPYSNGMVIDYYPLIESPDIVFGPSNDSTSNGSILIWLAILGTVAAACIGMAIVIWKRRN